MDPGKARFQDNIDWIWRQVLGCCHANRDTVATIEAARYSLQSQDTFEFRPCALSAPASPHVVGRAMRVL